MKVTLYGVLILVGMAAATPPTLSLAQSNAPATSAAQDTGTSAPKSEMKSETKTATPNTNMTPTKHRYWRHRGGTHPHFGSRRVRSQVQAPQ
ncbi:hypothetical protein XI06_01045 [Bradyrhizobium sp. CCBAU 11434]|uniref:Uncharacterized protein n=1 Tax=Bradyrhizobium zhengyangense TaxID=2911009 RepID=A0ABS9LVE1_9BRAD|nr:MULTISPECIES: hypothetical protein [Bradyrhizobium]MCG2640813.1 hypothetical protein [Bradyrhizobium zhengyangense]MCG2670647.1 hypothetical protein [Bradyrhizobium zhengyangense]MDA9518976.1 hypothetical protein [Bradyrhizobium sp. CCBAU 11434]